MQFRPTRRTTTQGLGVPEQGQAVWTEELHTSQETAPGVLLSPDGECLTVQCRGPSIYNCLCELSYVLPVDSESQMDPATIHCKMEAVCQGLGPRKTAGHE